MQISKSINVHVTKANVYNKTNFLCLTISAFTHFSIQQVSQSVDSKKRVRKVMGKRVAGSIALILLGDLQQYFVKL